ncbi:MAG: CotH kinase family protein, partial [Prevotella sp.]|nr:CotH kinase family protein [Prevotella sp.]
MFGKLKLMSIATLLAFVSGAFAADGKPTGTLPVVYINTENSKPIVKKEEKIPATIWIDAAGTDYASLGSEAAPVAFTVSGRGNYSWVGFDKKPYKVKFASKTSVLGMPKSKNFALLAHADDNLAFLRNAMGFELSRRMGLAWTPTQIPVELVLNGEYRGLYFFAETIKIDKNRVNITEQDEPAPAGADVTGGWLVEIDNYNSDPHVTINEPGYGDIWFTYKSPEVLSSEQETYLTNQLQAIMDAIYVEDKNSTEWEKYIDIDA